MAKLLDELARPIPNYIICPCGGQIYMDILEWAYTCNTCRFHFTVRELLNISKELSTAIREKYREFKRAQSDPMNQLPSYYRR